MSDALPEPDRAEGAPHPRHTVRLFGQEAAEDAFLDVWHGARMHHAWLITGPRGVGKATLAWRIARAALAAPGPPETLDVPPRDPVSRRLAALSEPRLFLLRRAWDAEAKRLRTVVTVDEVRRLAGFLSLRAADGGRRIVIVDAADEMNENAANALLKSLEEPGEDTLFLLVSHNPGRLLPTIRSRCRLLACRPLAPPALAEALEGAGVAPPGDRNALAELAAGSVGEAIRIAEGDGLAFYAEIVDLLATVPRLDRQRALALAAGAAGRAAEARTDLLLGLLGTAVARLARQGAGRPPEAEAATGEAPLLARLSPGPEAGQTWAALHGTLGERARHARGVNLDPSALILDMVLKINDTAALTSAR